MDRRALGVRILASCNPRGGRAATRLVLAAILSLFPSVWCHGEEPAGEKEAVEVRRILSELPKSPAEGLWVQAGRIVQLGRMAASERVIEALKEGLKHESDKVRLVAARALCQLHETDAGAAGLISLVRDARDADIRRFAANAIGLSATLYNNQAVADALGEALEREKDAKVRISIGRSLWRISSGRRGTETLMELLESAEKEASDEAALVLAENGFINHPKVRERLLMLYSEPTAQGERAFNLLRHAEEPGRDRPVDPKIRRGERLLREIVSNILAAYPDDPEKKKSDPERLFEEAAKGLVGSLDPYSQYLDREEVKATREMLSQDYGGIGAYVGMRDNVFTIISPIYGSPADKAGLRALDRILEVDGVKTSEIQPPFTGVIKRLKGCLLYTS
ncbi:MAG: HEAT repeat domain-containing protein, partial [Planctomycetota bacterium]|nr:HEAT repeat domain-containing protein [Planctomycetota bacterium]